MSNDTPSDPSEPADQQPAPAPKDRHVLLSAWGTFFAGVAALMTVATAVATSYVAVATYQDQKDEEKQKAANDAKDFAERVEFTVTGDNVAMIDNPNRFPLSRATMRFAGQGRDSVAVVAEMRTKMVPACSRLSVSIDKVFSGKWINFSGPDSKPEFWYATASFEDRDRITWTADGSAAFARQSEGEGSDTGADVKFVSFGANSEVAVINKSPRCK
ncbi:hypothetical protein ABZ092_20920 [Streptomyces bobili]|uniref:hypothetical protein n=1 Tax=Streptomyces bobili TaxID=67280 RepID=UPI0033AE1D2C